MKKERFARERLDAVDRVLGGQKSRGKLLEEIAWPREVEEKFFAEGASRLPEIEYAIDGDGVSSQIDSLRILEASIEGDDPVGVWLRATVNSQLEGQLLLLDLGTKRFYERSRELYGGARSMFFGGPVRNVDLAEHLLERLRLHGWDEARDPEEEPMSAGDLAAMLTERIARRRPKMDIEVVLDERTTAKVVAGMTRVRIRPDATFAHWEAEGLWHHEVETHALTAHNGALQESAPFLKSGGPRTTRTQEGLAIFSELYNRALSVARLERLSTRVKLVDMAEEGASFLDLYRYLIDKGSPQRDAYFDAQRICRGGLVSGGAPFTKDACYLGGLLEVYAFLAAVIRGGYRDEVELIVAGRLALDDVAILAELRAAGILDRPRYLPRWLAEWQSLLPYFAFASFMDGIDLAPVEAHYQSLIKVADAAKPSD